MGALARIWTWIKWPAALALLAWLFYHNRKDLSDFTAESKDWWFLSLALVLCLAAQIVTFVRWYMLVWALDFAFSVWDAFRLGFLGLLLNYVGGLVGGDMLKALFIAREQKSRRTAAAITVLLDRILGLLALFMLGALATLVVQDRPETGLHQAIFWMLWGGSLAGLAAIVIVLQPAVARGRWIVTVAKLPGVGPIVFKIMEGVAMYQSRPRVLVLALLMGMVSHAATFAALYFCALGLGGWAPSLWTHYYLMPAAVVAGLVPTPGGMGALEWAIQEAYGFAASGGITVEAAKRAGLFAALAFRLVNMLIAALGLVYYLPARRQIQAALHEPQPAAPLSDSLEGVRA